MKKAATVSLVSAVALAFGCGGTSAERPGYGSGGAFGSGGGAGGGKGSGGSGGTTTTSSTASGLDCTSPVKPANEDAVINGRSVYGYAELDKSSMSYQVEDSALTGTGKVAASSYAGLGVSFDACMTVEASSSVAFVLTGSWSGCNVELQIKTWDQTPKTQTPAGGCDQTGGQSCYNYPVKKQLAASPDAETPVSVTLAEVTNWSADSAKQVIGLQWQLTGDGCDVSVSISHIRFLP